VRRDPLAAIVQPAGNGAIVAVHVQPRAGVTQIVGLHGDALKIRVAAPPVDGRATAAARDALAAALEVPAARVALVSGERSRLKRFRVDGVDASLVRDRVAALLAGRDG
jgi:uncharacterized protein (TIGR00251 family)